MNDNIYFLLKPPNYMVVLQHVCVQVKKKNLKLIFYGFFYWDFFIFLNFAVRERVLPKERLKLENSYKDITKQLSEWTKSRTCIITERAFMCTDIHQRVKAIVELISQSR